MGTVDGKKVILIKHRGKDLYFIEKVKQLGEEKRIYWKDLRATRYAKGRKYIWRTAPKGKQADSVMHLALSQQASPARSPRSPRRSRVPGSEHHAASSSNRSHSVPRFRRGG